MDEKIITIGNRMYINEFAYYFMENQQLQTVCMKLTTTLGREGKGCKYYII